MTNQLTRGLWPLSSLVLAAAGVALIGTGLYFMLLRPPLLPEDLRYMDLSAVQVEVVRPRLEAWLTLVFRVMGGYVIATGVLTVTLGALIGGAASIGLMAAVNFVIDSDFKWILLAMALLWSSSLGLFWFEKRAATVRAS